jgi:uncharacterized membrane protein HdeD (DUF308 family)
MPGRGLQLFDIGVSTLAAIALAIAGTLDLASVLQVFGGWAIVSDVAQQVAALRRRRPEMGEQWSLLLAGGLSVIAGRLLQAGLLYWSLRKR